MGLKSKQRYEKSPFFFLSFWNRKYVVTGKKCTDTARAGGGGDFGFSLTVLLINVNLFFYLLNIKIFLRD